MKNLFILFLLLTVINLKDQFLPGSRIHQNLDKAWKFLNEDIIGGERDGLDDLKWRNLDLPHDWSVEGEFDKNATCTGTGGYLPTGIGWYRKSIIIPAENIGKKVFLQFDGVHMYSDVWVNEKHIGRYPYGYATFYYNITQFIKFSYTETNSIAVRVVNSAQPSSRWYNGAGINRHVWLTITSPLHIEKCGVTLTTPVVNKQEAEMDVKTNITVGRYPETVWSCWELDTSKNILISKIATLVTMVVNNKGSVVGEARITFKMQNFTRRTIQQKIIINSPELWSPESPYLYKVHSVLSINNKVVDENINPLGFRKLEFNPSKGLLVNNEPVKLKGVCLHHDAGILGSAVPEKIWILKLKLLKEMGCNAIRTSHCPFNPEFYDICDSLGLFVFNEAFDEWNKSWDLGQSESPAGKAGNGYHKYFTQWFETDLRNFIRRDKNRLKEIKLII